MALNGIEDKVNTSLLFDESLPLLLYINGKEKKIVSPNPSMTLLTYLRTVELLTATKLGCGEGGSWYIIKQKIIFTITVYTN